HEGDLCQTDDPVCAYALCGDFDQWKTRLLCPCRTDLLCRFPCSGVERFPEIFGGRIRALVRGQERLDAMSKGLFANKILQHAQEKGSLLIRNHIERAPDLVLICDWLPDRMRYFSGVEGHSRFLLIRRVQPALPLRVKMISGFNLHP